MKQSINWFEIPTVDMDRAVAFYERTLGVTLKRELFGGMPHAIFPTDGPGTGTTGALVTGPHLTPGATGVVIYLEAPDGVTASLARARAAGAVEIAPHMAIGDNGWMAVVRDPDGNHVGLHSMTRP